MVMHWIFTGILSVSLLFSVILGRGAELAAATVQGAQAGVTLAISLAGSLCLWSGIGQLMQRLGVTAALHRLFRPVLGRIFPSTKKDPQLAGLVSGNLCANLLGLGNAATPLGLKAVQRFAELSGSHAATDEMCRLIVLNTASIQLIPTTVAALRASAGCQTPFDILPAVWLTSLLSSGLGLCAAWLLGRLWKP